MAATGELVEMLAKALRRSRMSANDRGALGRLRGAGETFVDEPRPGYFRSDVFPERLNDHGASGPSVTRQRWNWRAEKGISDNWNLDAETQGMLDSLSPVERARLMAQNGDAAAMSPYDRTALRQNDPDEASRLVWGMPDDPSLEFAPDFSPRDDLAGMIGANGELAPPEQFLGRPLTPDHIWNDPKFQRRLDMTSDLEGVRTPEERFHIAMQREQELSQRPPHRAAAARWGVDDPVARMALLGAGLGGGGLSLREVLRDQWSA